MKTLYSKTRAFAISGAIFFGLLGVASSQNVRTDQIISLQNYTAPQYTIKFGASTALNTNYTFFLPAAQPTTLNQTLIVTGMNAPSSTYTLGWGTPAGTGWYTNGNTLVNSTTEFMGTTDTAQFNLRANNLRVMNYRPATSVGAGPTIIGGYASNVAGTYNGATISGGGKSGAVNTIAGDYGTIGGGSGNTAGIKSVIPGGVNLKIGDYSFGFSSDNGSSVTDVSGMSNIAYFGNTNVVVGNVDGSAREVRFYEPNNSLNYSGASYTSFKAGTMSSNVTYTLPTTQGGANTVLTNNGSGALSWASPSTPTGICYAVVTESAFGSSQNNLNLTSISSNTVFRISSNSGGDNDCYNDNDDDDDDGSNVYLTGINASGVCDGKMIILMNVGNYTISLKNESSSSTSTNRFSFYKDVALTTKQGITLIYDATSHRWRMAGRPQ